MGAQKHQLIVHEQPKSPIAEAYRTLRTNIQYAKVDGELKVLLFTSAGPGEGKSTVAANTAVALAQTGNRVILVDCDLRKPVQHHLFHLNKKGLTNCLVGESSAAELLQDTEIEGLRVLTSGPVPPNAGPPGAPGRGGGGGAWGGGGGGERGGGGEGGGGGGGEGVRG